MQSSSRYLTFVRYLTLAVALSMSIYHLSVGFFGTPDAFTLRSTHVGFALVLCFLTLPMLARDKERGPAALGLGADRAQPGGLRLSGAADRLHLQPLHLCRRPAHDRHRARHHADPAGDRGGAARARPGAADHGGDLPDLRAVLHRHLARHAARADVPDDRGHLRHPGRGLGDLCRAVHPVRRLRRALGRGQALHGLRHLADRPRRRRPGQGRLHHQRAVRLGLGLGGRQRHDDGHLHHPADEAAGLSPGLRRRGRGGGLDGRADHAADHGRGRLRHGRVHGGQLPAGGRLRADPGAALLRRRLRRRAFRGQAHRHEGPAARGTAAPRRGAARARAPVPAARHHRRRAAVGLQRALRGALRHRLGHPDGAAAQVDARRSQRCA